MANEATIKCSLQILKNNLQYRNYPTDFQGDITGENGPTPGAFNVTTAGVDVDLSELTTPGYCVIRNLDSTNFFEIGLFISSTFHELAEVLPGESYVIRLSRNVSNLRLKADTAALKASVECFEA